MPEAEEADGQLGQFRMHASRVAGPVGPVAAPQARIRVGERNAARQQGRHDEFRDRLLVAEAVADDGARRNRGHIDPFISCRRHMEQPEAGGNRWRGVESIGNENFGCGEGGPVRSGDELLGQHDDLVRLGDQLVQALREHPGVRAVEDDPQANALP